MSGRKIVIASVVCVLIGILIPGLSQAQRYRQSTTTRTNSRQTQQMTVEERQKQFEEQVARQKAEREKWMAERQKEAEQRMKDMADGKSDNRNRAIKTALEMTDEQWKVVEPKINRIYFLKDQASINIAVGGTGGYRMGGSSGGGGMGSSYSAGTGSSGVRTNSSTAGSTGTGGGEVSAQGSSGGGGGFGGGIRSFSGPIWRLADRELTDGEKTCDKLKELLDDKNSKDEQIEQEITALRQAREEAAKELAKARVELREVLTPRQQARLVLSNLLD